MWEGVFRRIHANQSGVSLIELSITLIVLSVLMIVSMMTILHIGRVFTKNLHEKRVRNISDSIIDSVYHSVRSSGVEVVVLETTYQETADPDNIISEADWNALTPASLKLDYEKLPWQGYCIGNKEYSFKPDTQFKRDGASGKQSDEVFIISKGCDALANPKTDIDQRSEQMIDFMRVIDFRVCISGWLHTVHLTLALGGDPNDTTYDSAVFDKQNSYPMEDVKCNDFLKNDVIVACKSAESFCAYIKRSQTIDRKIR